MRPDAGVITHSGCLENTRKVCKSGAGGEWFITWYISIHYPWIIEDLIWWRKFVKKMLVWGIYLNKWSQWVDGFHWRLMVKMLAISRSMGDIIPLSPEFFYGEHFKDFRLKCLFLRLMANFLVFDSFNGYRLTSSRLCQCNSKIFLTNTYGDVQQLTGRTITDQILGDFECW